MDSIINCPICSSVNIRYSCSGKTTRKLDQSIWTIFACDDCTHEFMNPRPTWKELMPYYSDSYSPYDPNHGSPDNDAATLEIARQTGTFRHIKIQPGAQLLDVGCGGGYFLRIMQQLGFVVTGVEPSDAGAAVTQKNGLNVFHGTLEQFKESGPHRRFDVITSSHVLEHVPNPLETLRNMKDLLSPNGYIWIAVPNAACFWARKLGAQWHSRDLPYHLQQFTSNSLTFAARHVGLKVNEISTYSLPISVGASIRQYLRQKFMIPGRLSHRLAVIDDFIANRVAKRLDKQSQGEALLATLVS